jgi:hypothetical protein
MKRRWFAAFAAALATSALATSLTPEQEAQADRYIAQSHREAQQIHTRWYRGFVGDGVNECRETGGTWPPTQDLARNDWQVHVEAAAQLAPGHYMEIYTDGGSTTLVYATTRGACQQILESMIETKAGSRQ